MTDAGSGRVPSDRQAARPGTLAGAWEWLVEPNRVVLSEWLRRDRGLPPEYAVTTIEAMFARVHADDREYVEDALRSAVAARRPFAATYRIVDGLGRLRTVTNAADVVPDGPLRVIGASLDLATTTAAVQSGDAPFMDAILETLAEGLVACSRSGVPLIVNGAARRLYESATGARWDEHTGREWIERLLGTPPRSGQLAPWRNPVALALAGTPVSDLEIEVGGAPGSRSIVLLSARPIGGRDTGTSADGAVVTLHDVTRQRTAEALIARDLTHDRITGLPNRRRLCERLALALADPDRAPLGVIVVAVDGITPVTETFGYDAGDAVLGAVARSLVGELDTGDLAGSIGGDAFAVVCVDGATERTEELAARILRAVEAPRTLPGSGGRTTEVTVTARAGIVYAADDATPEGMLGDAGTAAGAASRGTAVTFHPDDDMARALRTAVGGELVLHYQPKLGLESRRIVGVEALVRWDRPGHGLVPPDEFIPAAERGGVIADLGAWVLRAALSDARRWTERPDAPPGFRVAVNVSASQFDAGFIELVRVALDEAGVPPSVLCVEVTESVVMRDVRSAVGTLHALRALGVTVAIDDFGTGYSSLAYLRDFPADELKIDRSFVGELGGHNATALVGGVVSIAHALSLEVVAEGVETDEQLVALATVGCDTVQGYLFSRPVPADRLDALLSAEPARATVTDDPGPGRPGGNAILVADDAEDVRLLARMSLATSGFEVHEAADGPVALEIARRFRPATVVLDVWMPGMDGFAVCRALRADPATADCTIVMLTATATAADKIDAYTAGADDYIVKPFAPRDLVARVRAAQRRRAESVPRET